MTYNVVTVRVERITRQVEANDENVAEQTAEARGIVTLVSRSQNTTVSRRPQPPAPPKPKT